MSLMAETNAAQCMPSKAEVAGKSRAEQGEGMAGQVERHSWEVEEHGGAGKTSWRRRWRGAVRQVERYAKAEKEALISD